MAEKKDDAAKEAEGTEDEAPQKSGGPGLITSLLIAVVAAAGTFGMVWLATGPTPPVECVVVEPEPVDPYEIEARGAKYVTLEPIIVSLGPEAGAKHLKVSIVLGTPPDAKDFTEVQFLRVRDRFLERLRTVDTQMISDPEAMPALKEALLHQAQATLGRDAVYSVLITDFLMS